MTCQLLLGWIRLKNTVLTGQCNQLYLMPTAFFLPSEGSDSVSTTSRGSAGDLPRLPCLPKAPFSASDLDKTHEKQMSPLCCLWVTLKQVTEHVQTHSWKRNELHLNVNTARCTSLLADASPRKLNNKTFPRVPEPQTRRCHVRVPF